MCLPVLPAVIAGSALLGAGATAYSASKSAKSAKAQMAQSEAQARAQAQTAETRFNQANQKMPSLAAMFQGNQRSASRGIGSTFLTGSRGVPTSAMPLGGAPSLLGS